MVSTSSKKSAPIAAPKVVKEPRLYQGKYYLLSTGKDAQVTFKLINPVVKMNLVIDGKVRETLAASFYCEEKQILVEGCDVKGDMETESWTFTTRDGKSTYTVNRIPKDVNAGRKAVPVIAYEEATAAVKKHLSALASLMTVDKIAYTFFLNPNDGFRVSLKKINKDDKGEEAAEVTA